MITHIVAKTAVFDRQGRVLVLWRAHDDAHRPGGADLPGGRVEDGESLAAGAVREVAEESGLQVHADVMQLLFATTKAAYHNEEKAVTNIVWFGFVVVLPAEQTVHLSFEHHRFAWLTLDEAVNQSDGTTQKQFLEYLREHDLLKKPL